MHGQLFNCSRVSWKESLSSVGQQIHNYQLNEQSPLNSNYWTKKSTPYWAGNPDSDLRHVLSG